MDFFIKKISEGKVDKLVHNQFQKFSRGEFPRRAMFKIKNTKGNYTIDTTSEYARELVRFMGERLGDQKTTVTGALISALDLEGQFKFEEKKSAIGVRKYLFNREMTGKEIVALCDTVEKAFFGLSFKVGTEELKIKDKSPKSMKGASSSKNGEDDELKIDFCKLKTADRKIVDNLLFEKNVPEFKKVAVYHDLSITDIVIPPELKDEKDFAKVREGARRKGTIKRVVDIDGNVVKTEMNLEA